MNIILTNLLAFGTLFASILAITSQNPVISVIFVIATFVQAAGYLILIGINFIGISYIVIYVGAIAVLFLFVIMMINIKLTDILETGTQYTKSLPLALAIGALFIFVLVTLIPYNFNNIFYLSILFEYIANLNHHLVTHFVTPSELLNISVNIYQKPEFADVTLNDILQIEVLGHSLYTYGAALLIELSIILLLAMVATIIISRSNNK